MVSNEEDYVKSAHEWDARAMKAAEKAGTL